MGGALISVNDLTSVRENLGGSIEGGSRGSHDKPLHKPLLTNLLAKHINKNWSHPLL